MWCPPLPCHCSRCRPRWRCLNADPAALLATHVGIPSKLRLPVPASHAYTPVPTPLMQALAFGGPPAVKLLDLIAQNRHAFDREPIGPVGMYLGLKEAR